MKTLTIATILALASVAASASTISLLSGVSAGESNSVTGTNVVVQPAGVWATDPNGALWISDENTGVGGITQPNSLLPFAIFDQTFYAPEAMTGTLSIHADDTAAVILDGNLLYGPSFTPGGNCVNHPIGCTPAEGLVLNISVGAGPHEFSFPLWQLYGSVSALNYDVQLSGTDTTATPEPASLALVGIGLGLLLLVGIGRIAARLIDRIAESGM